MTRAGALAGALALFALSLAFATQAGAQERFDSSGRQTVLVIPLSHWHADHCPDRSMPCADAAELAAIGPPRNTSREWQSKMAYLINRNYNRLTYGQVGWRFVGVHNSRRNNGWWRAPSTYQQYKNSSDAVFVGSPSLARDALERVLDQAVRQGDITPFEIRTATRVIVLQNLQNRGGTANGPFCYNVPGPGGCVQYTVAAVREDASDPAALKVIAHELGHQLGLPDLYRKPENSCDMFYSGDSCVGAFDPMDQDQRMAHFSAFSLIHRGWLRPTEDNVVDIPFAPLLAPRSFSRTERILPLTEPAGRRVIRIGEWGDWSGRRIFSGFNVECRTQRWLDLSLDEPGAVVYFENDLGNPYAMTMRPAEGASANPEDVNQSALRPGESITLPQSTGTLRITFVNYVAVRPRSGDPTPCEIRIDWFLGGEPRPNPRVGAPTATTDAHEGRGTNAGIWIDSLRNGLGRYPLRQRVGRKGEVRAPRGPGDPPWKAHPNRVWFVMANGAPVPARDVTARIDITQPAALVEDCTPATGPPAPPRNPAFSARVEIPEIGPRETIARYVEWTPENAEPARIEVRLESTASGRPAAQPGPSPDAGFSADDDYAVSTVGFAQMPVTRTGPRPDSVFLDLATSHGCDEARRFLIAPADQTPGRLAVSSRIVSLPPGREQRVPLTLAATENAEPGAPKTTLMRIFGQREAPNPNAPEYAYGPAWEEVGTVEIKAAVVRPTRLQLSCSAPPLAATGRLSPARPGQWIAVEFTSPTGNLIRRGARTGRGGKFRVTLKGAGGGSWRARASMQSEAGLSPATSKPCGARVRG